MEARCAREVRDLHRFFHEWFLGRLENSDQQFARVADVLAQGFVIVSPEGRLTGRDELLAGLRGAHGSWARESGRDSRIWTEDYRLRWEGGEMALATYQEWQRVEARTRGRLSTALFRRRQGTPNGVEWLHVHEVWLPPGEPKRR